VGENGKKEDVHAKFDRCYAWNLRLTVALIIKWILCAEAEISK